jgi:hypothetical protein
MPFLIKGGITLDGVQFNTDPAVYQPLEWDKRAQVQKGVGGVVTIQDFGAYAADNVLRMQSGDSRPMEESVVASLHAKYRTKSATYTLTDWIGNTFTVFILKFSVEPIRKGRDSIGNIVSLYKYQMECQVLAIVNLFGSGYGGA